MFFLFFKRETCSRRKHVPLPVSRIKTNPRKLTLTVAVKTLLTVSKPHELHDIETASVSFVLFWKPHAFSFAPVVLAFASHTHTHSRRTDATKRKQNQIRRKQGITFYIPIVHRMLY